MKLNAKQKRFCLEYVQDYNATKAAIRAGYSQKTARSMGSENLTKPDILAYVHELQKKTLDEMGLNASRIIAETFHTYEKSIEIQDYKSAIKALDLLGKQLGIYNNINKPEKQPISELWKALDGDKK